MVVGVLRFKTDAILRLLQNRHHTRSVVDVSSGVQKRTSPNRQWTQQRAIQNDLFLSSFGLTSNLFENVDVRVFLICNGFIHSKCPAAHRGLQLATL